MSETGRVSETDYFRAYIQIVGERFYGVQWAKPLAQALGVSERTVRRHLKTPKWVFIKKVYALVLAVGGHGSSVSVNIAAYSRASTP